MKCLFVFTCWLFVLGCQTPLTDAFNESVFPPEAPADYALLPITFPVGLVIPVIDITIVNPVYGAIEAPAATGRFWDLGKDSPGLHSALIPVKVLGTPFVFLGYILFGEQFLPLENWSWFRPKAKKSESSDSSKDEPKTPVSDEERERRKKEAELEFQEIKDLK